MELELGPSFCLNSAVPITHSHSHFVKAATGPLAQMGNDSLKRAETMVPIQLITINITLSFILISIAF